MANGWCRRSRLGRSHTSERGAGQSIQVRVAARLRGKKGAGVFGVAKALGPSLRWDVCVVFLGITCVRSAHRISLNSIHDRVGEPPALRKSVVQIEVDTRTEKVSEYLQIATASVATVAGSSACFVDTETPMTLAAMLGEEARIVRVTSSHDPLNHNQQNRC
jgi:hypothetical protein